MAYAGVVPPYSQPNNSISHNFPGSSPISPEQTTASTSSSKPYENDSSKSVRKIISSYGISQKAEAVILASWRKNTRERYRSVLHKWEAYCSTRGTDPVHTSESIIVEFLNSLYEGGSSYHTICQARSALNSVIRLAGHNHIADHSLIARFMKGVFNLRPPLPRKTVTWDIGKVLLYINNSMADNAELSLKDLTYKVITLLMILSGSRVNTIEGFQTDAMTITKDTYTFHLTKLLKHSRPKFMGRPVVYRAYPQNKKLCIYEALTEYIKRKRELGSTNVLMMTHRRPHGPASHATMARWLKDMLKLCGINTDIFKAHSYRSATTSYAQKSVHMPIQKILKQGQWTQQNTWWRYYCKDIEENNQEDQEDEGQFGNDLLEGL